MKKGDKIFVYGTLRPTGCNGRLLEGRANHLGNNRIEGATLYNLGWFPGVKLGGGSQVEGDLFEITCDTLPDSLDRYEGYPQLYDRQIVQTVDGQETWVYTYNYDVSDERIIKEGVWGGN